MAGEEENLLEQAQKLLQQSATDAAAQTNAAQAKVNNAVENAKKEISSKGAFGVLRTEGVGAALKNNFGKEAWEASKSKLIFKGAGVAVGLGAVADALIRSESKDVNGEAQKRSVVGRFTEALAGGTLAVGSALHGGR